VTAAIYSLVYLRLYGGGSCCLLLRFSIYHSGYTRQLAASLFEADRLSATFLSMPIDRDRAPLNAARASLANATAALADELAEMERLHAPALRLGRIGEELAAVEKALGEMRNFDNTSYGHWLASGQIGERPAVDLDRIHLEARHLTLLHDHAAAATVKPQAEASYDAQAQRVTQAQQTRDEALSIAAVDAAAAFAASVWIDQLQTALESEAVLRGLADELRTISERTPGAAAAAMAIYDLVRKTRGAVATPLNPEPGRRLLAELTRDARARL